MSDLLLAGGRVLSFRGTRPVRGPVNDHHPALPHEVAVSGARFAEGSVATVTVIDCSDCVVVPGLIDAHTHLRVTGGSDALIAFSRVALVTGTTAFEVKVSAPDADRLLDGLRDVKRCALDLPQRVSVSVYAGDVVPAGQSQGGWAGEMANEILPIVAREGLAQSVDLRVEIPSLALEHAARLATAAEALGLEMRVHADQFADNQTASFAARWGFRSAAHLNHTSPEGVADLASSDTAAVLLPGTTARLRQTRRPFARQLVDRGAVVALGTDHGLPSSNDPSMLGAMSAARAVYDLGSLDALAAATINAAWTLGSEGVVGRIEPGLRADAVVLDAEWLEDPTGEPVVAVMCEGRMVYIRHGEEGRISGPGRRTVVQGLRGATRAES